MAAANADEALKMLLNWRRGGTSFSCRLFELMQVADPQNRSRLERAFPLESAALGAWMNSTDEEAFLRGIQP